MNQLFEPRECFFQHNKIVNYNSDWYRNSRGKLNPKLVKTIKKHFLTRMWNSINVDHFFLFSVKSFFHKNSQGEKKGKNYILLTVNQAGLLYESLRWYLSSPKILICKMSVQV